MLTNLLLALRSALVCTLSLLATASLAQTTIHVGPGQAYATIQSGINAAVNGDTVLVAPGTYKENINFNGKAITLTSSGGVASTTIDGGYEPGIATVTIADGETNAVISGFTIRGGGDTIFTGTSDGGIYVGNASASIQGNTITANYCHNIDVEFGVATISGNEVSGVLQSSGQTGADESYCTFGSGINLQGTNYFINGLGSTVIANLIDNNLTGSGINLWAAQNVLIMGNTIRNNTSFSPGSAFISANSKGTVIVQNLIHDNTSGCGGAIAPEDGGLSASDPVVLIANNTIVDNVVTPQLASGSECTDIAQIYPGPYSYGSSGPGVLVVNNIISGSTSYPAVNCSWFSAPSLANQPTFENNILYNAGGPFFGSYCVDVSNQDNNIAADPQFVNPGADFHVKSTSPAIDSGQNSVLETFTTMTGLIWTLDAGGFPRVQDATGKGCIIDMGIYESPGSTQCGTTETLTSSLNPASAGQTVTFKAQLTSGSDTPTGTIQFLDGANLLSTQTVSTAGSATFSTNALTVGSHTITANYQPTGTSNASTASLTQVITGYATNTGLTCLPNPVIISYPTQFTATVTSANGTPTGSVSITDNGGSVGTQTLLNGAASFADTLSSVGTHEIVATYTPSGSFSPSTATCSEVVNALPTTSTLAVAPTNSTYGSPVALTATVSPATLPGPSTPTGAVSFLNGATAIGTGTLAGGIATISAGTLPGGSYNLTCTYGGSTIYATSSCAPVPVVVNAAPTVLTISSANNPAPFLSTINFTVFLKVNGQSAGAGNTIRLSIDGQIISFMTDASGGATCAIFANLPPNSYPVVVTFAGTNNLLASSASLTQVITADATSTSLTAAPNPGNLNLPVTMTATVSSPATSAQVGSGKVTFYDGATSLGSAQVTGTGTATVTASFSTVGIHNLTGVYAGNADFSGSTSAVFKETITTGDFSISVLPAAASLYTGEAATANVAVTSLRGFNQPLALTCTNLPANTTCTFTSPSLANGQGTSNLVIQTSAPHRAGSISSAAASLGALTLLLLPTWRRRRSSFAGLSLMFLAIAISIGMVGCGTPNPITGGTPPSTYQVAVTATTSETGTALTHSAVFTLTVKSLF